MKKIRYVLIVCIFTIAVLTAIKFCVPTKVYLQEHIKTYWCNIHKSAERFNNVLCHKTSYVDIISYCMTETMSDNAIHEALLNEQATHPANSVNNERTQYLTEEVSYTNLCPRNEYIIFGSIISKKKQDVLCTTYKIFRPDESNGICKLRFCISADKAKDDLVVFEHIKKITWFEKAKIYLSYIFTGKIPQSILSQ